MAYVGLDASYSGFGVVRLNAAGDNFITALGKFEAKRYGSEVERLLAIKDFSRDAALPGDKVALEGYAVGAKFGREKSGALRAAVTMGVYEVRQTVPAIVAPTALKKYALGKGVGDKSLILKAVYRNWGADIDDDNIADAYVLARIARDLDLYETEGRFPEHAYQREVLDGILKAR